MHDRENRRFRKLIKIFRDFRIIFRRIQSFHELVNCILTTKFIKSMNSTKVARRTPTTTTTTIFKLIGPCEIFSHGQKKCHITIYKIFLSSCHRNRYDNGFNRWPNPRQIQASFAFSPIFESLPNRRIVDVLYGNFSSIHDFRPTC